MISLIILLVTITFPLVLFAILAVQINGGLDYWPWDQSILSLIHQTSQANLDHIAAFLTHLGTVNGVLPASVLLIGFFFVRQQWRKGFYLLTTMVGAFLISYNFKLFFHRPRPHFWTSFFPLPSDYSFPSGHALFSLAFILSLIILAWQSRWRWGVLLLGSGFAIAIAWTRLYLGVHYPSDILAGWLLAIAWVTLVTGLFNFRQQRALAKSAPTPS